MLLPVHEVCASACSNKQGLSLNPYPLGLGQNNKQFPWESGGGEYMDLEPLDIKGLLVHCLFEGTEIISIYWGPFETLNIAGVS